MKRKWITVINLRLPTAWSQLSESSLIGELEFVNIIKTLKKGFHQLLQITIFTQMQTSKTIYRFCLLIWLVKDILKNNAGKFWVYNDNRKLFQ